MEEEMFFNRTNIKELLDCDWSPELEEYIVTMRGEITKIDNHFGWYYISCNACSKKIEPANGVYNCHICNRECKFPLVKYKIHLKVKDKTGESSVVLFNVVAEKQLDTSAHKLLNRLSSDDNDVPTQIQSFCKKEFIFKIKLNNYNLQEGLENFTVSKVFVPVENLEIQFQSRKDKKGKSLLDDENEPKEQKTKRLIIKKAADVSFDNLEDSDEDQHVNDGVMSRKRRNIIIDNDEFSDEDTN
ncbi:replication protein A 70 kDa DNA-binding subunit D-like isoform X1 [Nicotiana tomentosiformis]|uniref:replication protein A 70 kDa DNA-binding subunit D-like isoform X1 n=2 Tax=Nicotiana tomentosiformis TaxID=4098 RepID=UPI00051AB7F2|nr:uncharacterized protein LOC104090575 [Nicotiana tomentosiformis]XP_009593992.1 uncharacterized protein LOC104090575 [Nicotiana tomentosiformis]XP_009593994.1 uncharacterized protein LOC104090575 [Nicotiana tomentosiformis]XP_009593995.1 uncharacterized protein LOC104090575 [Nicotiana tomentosiformis]XP_009593996.1 uncharacterized protein LOC104090575 [Nicotiana tomentosiformis]XP_009593997.1 uncharacterized protein LOC104090575 [Nicotiana tomentosiformis]XP_018624423.1 uncharacterized prot